ncbi:MAG: response regulator [Candidatus Sericytochromatia bacterium]
MEKILIVDDDITITSTLGLAAGKLGYHVSTFNSPIKAAQTLKKEHFDLVISDINMPEVTGIDLLLWIKKHHPNTKVAIVTSEDDSKYPEIARKQNVVKYIKKPVDISNIENILKFCLRNEDKVQGHFSKVTFFDFIQMLAFLNVNKKVCINVEDKQMGYVYVKNGAINHAEYADLKGENALFEIIKNNKGSFYEIDYEEPSEITINKPISKLILTAARIRGEHEALEAQDITKLKLEKGLKVLLSDNDAFHQIALEKFLSKLEFSVDFSDDTNQLINKLSMTKYNLLIVDFKTLELLDYGSIFDMILMNNNDIKIIVMMDTEEDKSKIKMQRQVSFIEKPVDLKSFGALISTLYYQKEDPNILGTVVNVTFSELMQIVGFDGIKRIIGVKDLVFDKHGIVCIEGGNVIYANYDGEEGLQAFFNILDIKSAVFNQLQTYDVTGVKSIGNINSLLMQFAEQKDNQAIQTDNKDNITYSSESLALDKLI